MKKVSEDNDVPDWANRYHQWVTANFIALGNWINNCSNKMSNRFPVFVKDKVKEFLKKEEGDVPGWVLVVLMTTGLVTAIWTIAAPKLSSILKNSLDSMNGIR